MKCNMGRKLKYAESDLLDYARQGLDNAEIAKKLGTQPRNIAQRLRKIRSENGITYGKPMDKPAPRPQKWDLRVNDTVSYKGGSRYMVKTVTKTEFTIQMVSYNARLNKPPVLTFSKTDYCSGKLRMRRVNLPPVTIYKLNSREKSADKEGERVSKTITDTERVAQEIEQFQADEMPCDDMFCDENEKGFCTTDRCIKPSVPIKDSGTRRNFPTGAVRDMATGKGDMVSLPPDAMLRLSVLYENGAVKYDRFNYLKGIPVTSFIDSALRHIFKYMAGYDDEDHLSSAIFNLLGAEQMEANNPEMCDLPTRAGKRTFDYREGLK